MKESTYAILGLGRFGCKLTTVLSATGAPILIADSDQDKVNQYADRAMEVVPRPGTRD